MFPSMSPMNNNSFGTPKEPKSLFNQVNPQSASIFSNQNHSPTFISQNKRINQY